MNFCTHHSLYQETIMPAPQDLDLNQQVKPVDQNDHPFPSPETLELKPPLNGLSKLKDEPGVSGSNYADGDGVLGQTFNGNSGVGVHGSGDTGTGVLGESYSGKGVAGVSKTGQGVYGHSISQAGVVGESDKFDGVFGVSHNLNTAGVSGHNPGGLAGYFDGNVTVTGDINLIDAADCAEDFNIGTDVFVEPGTVMVLGKEGELFPSQHAYDKCVAGVVSGAGDYKPGIVLDKQQSESNRQPIALLGKVYCKVDAQYGSIEIGDLLTTSPTLGHAMKAEDQTKAFGSVIGKALRSLVDGQGLIPILIALQ
jgi:hypothetical protein